MRLLTDSQGRATITLAQQDVQLTFAIAAIDGVAFPAASAVEVDDERVLRACDTLGALAGLSRKDILWPEGAHGTAEAEMARSHAMGSHQ